MKDKDKERLEELFEGSEDAYIVATKNGVGIVGYHSETLALLSMLIEKIRTCDGITDELIDEAVKLSKLDDKQRLERALNALKKVIEKL